MNENQIRIIDERACMISSQLNAIEETILALDERHRTDHALCINAQVNLAKQCLDELMEVATMK